MYGRFRLGDLSSRLDNSVDPERSFADRRYGIPLKVLPHETRMTSRAGRLERRANGNP